MRPQRLRSGRRTKPDKQSRHGWHWPRTSPRCQEPMPPRPPDPGQPVPQPPGPDLPPIQPDPTPPSPDPDPAPPKPGPKEPEVPRPIQLHYKSRLTAHGRTRLSIPGRRCDRFSVRGLRRCAEAQELGGLVRRRSLSCGFHTQPYDPLQRESLRGARSEKHDCGRRWILLIRLRLRTRSGQVEAALDGRFHSRPGGMGCWNIFSLVFGLAMVSHASSMGPLRA